MKDVCAWYREHYGGFVLSTSSTREVALIEFGALVDPYPLVEYMVGGLRMVMLKRFVLVKGAVGNLEDLALNLNKYKFQIPPPPFPLHSCPASKVPTQEEAGVHSIEEAR